MPRCLFGRFSQVCHCAEQRKSDNIILQKIAAWKIPPWPEPASRENREVDKRHQKGNGCAGDKPAAVFPLPGWHVFSAAWANRYPNILPDKGCTVGRLPCLKARDLKIRVKYRVTNKVWKHRRARGKLSLYLCRKLLFSYGFVRLFLFVLPL